MPLLLDQEVTTIAGEPGHELSPKEREKIDKAFEAFDKILRTAREEQIKVLLEGTILMNMVDMWSTCLP